jgi:hypothetical protein
VSDGMDGHDVRSLVKGWHTRARREGDHVSIFVFLWFCFNPWLACESQEDTDRAMIDSLTGGQAEASQVRVAYHSAMRSEVFVGYIRELADQSPVVSNGRRPRVVRIDSLEDFAGIVNGSTRFGAISSTAPSASGIRAMKRWLERVPGFWNSGWGN